VNPFGYLRAVVWLKRISKSLARIADAEEKRYQIELAHWEKENVRPIPKHTAFDVMDDAAAEKSWRRAQETRTGLPPEE
jgi:hypothetical protein